MMENKPFKSNPDQKVKSMLDAADHIFQAIKALEAARACSDNWAEYATITDFKRELDEFISCDGGEGGLAIYALMESRMHFSGERAPKDELKQLIAKNKKGK